MTIQDPALTPTLRRWIDDAVRRQVDQRLHAVFGSTADELCDRLSQAVEASARSAITDPSTADEIRQTALAYDADWESPAGGLARALARIAERFEPARLDSPRHGTAPVADDLPATLEELRHRSLSAEQAAARLGVNSSRIRQRLLARTLYGFKDGRSWWVPEFQLVGDRAVPGVDKVFPALSPSVSPVAVARWFVTPWADLIVDEERETVVSPRTWLLEGRDPAPVAAQAREL